MSEPEGAVTNPRPTPSGRVPNREWPGPGYRVRVLGGSAGVIFIATIWPLGVFL